MLIINKVYLLLFVVVVDLSIVLFQGVVFNVSVEFIYCCFSNSINLLHNPFLTDFQSNIVMRVLASRGTAKILSEKIMLLINREG